MSKILSLKKLLSPLVLVSLTTPAWALPPSSTKSEFALASQCDSAVLIEPLSGEVLFEKDADKALPPASMVKMMVAYVALRQIKEGAFNLTDQVTTSAAASKIGGSQVYLREHEQFTLDEMLTAIMIQSANDAAYAVAEHIAGSREGFVDMMNAEAERLGMSKSRFTSPHGLPPSKGDEPDLMSAKDSALLAAALLKEFPEILKTTGTLESDFRAGEFKMRSHNHLLRTFPGCDGFKTGYYAKAGFSVTATAQRKGVRMIAAVMGCDARKVRDSETARLMSRGFSQMKTVKLIEKGVPVDQMASLVDGDVSAISPVTASELVGVVRAGSEGDIQKKVNLCQGLQAPVAADTACGSISFVQGEREIGSVNLVIPRNVPKVGFVGKVKQLIGL